ncbi:COP9 signalosome subunit 6 [Pilobolus umbonatus]|nr:COP9 signalosome subunit 6 [Pilobolus umbonatus]
MTDMDIIDDNSMIIVSNVQSSSGLSISVHPLVLLNISDHFTRFKLQNPSLYENRHKIYGALLASQSGRDIDIVNSFELPLLSGEKVTLDKEYLMYKLEQLKQVFPQLDFMGWYTIGSSPTNAELELHEQFLQVSESALFLQLDPSAVGNNAKEFPLEIYESVRDIMDDKKSRLVFIQTRYKVETGEAECIAVDHVAKPSTSSSDGGVGNTLIAHLTTQRNAIAMLNSRIQFLQKYLLDTKSGHLPVDHDIIRQISSLCRRSPILEKKSFDEQFSAEYDDVLLVAYLASITKGLNSINDLVDKFNLVNGNNAPNNKSLIMFLN